MVPLALAVQVIWAKVYERRHNVGQAKEQLLNSLAGMLLAMVTVYEYTPDSEAAPRIVPAKQLSGGMFKGGGKELRFLDGRPPRRNLAVAADEVTIVIEKLQQDAL